MKENKEYTYPIMVENENGAGHHLLFILEATI
jgi:hypothetical protein